MKLFTILLLLSTVNNSFQKTKPNVVAIVADDLGFNDVSFRGSNEIPTPNIDALAFNGAILNRFYTPPLCTPSRSSFMTGKYPHKLGMQHSVILSSAPWALGKDEKILPEYFKDAGYSTTLIGKWHLGFYQQQYTPTKRGFDKFFGFLGPFINYFNYELKEENYTEGYDLRRNNEIAKDFDPLYATDLFTREAVKAIEDHEKDKPLFLLINHLAPHAGSESNGKSDNQAPLDDVENFSYIKNEKRRKLAAMISKLDGSVGEVVKSLSDKKMLENTVIVFYSDNGGPVIGIHSTEASNYPLRGQKGSSWEGAIRTNAIVYAPFLANKRVIRDQLFHVSDWLPTFAGLADFVIDQSVELDGVDQWETINNGGESVRDEVVNVDDVDGFGSLIHGKYKYVNGTANDGLYDGWLALKPAQEDKNHEQYASGVLSSPVSKAISSNLTTEEIIELRKAATVKCSNEARHFCDLSQSSCLFDIFDDPCEKNNLAETRPIMKKLLRRKYLERTEKVIPSRIKESDSASDPKNFNFNWNWWQENSKYLNHLI